MVTAAEARQETRNRAMKEWSRKAWNFRRDEGWAFLLLSAVSAAVWGISFLMPPTVMS